MYNYFSLINFGNFNIFPIRMYVVLLHCILSLIHVSYFGWQVTEVVHGHIWQMLQYLHRAEGAEFSITL